MLKPTTNGMNQILQFPPANFSGIASLWAAKIAVSAFIFLAFLAVSAVVKKMICRWGHRTDPQKQAVLELIGGIARMALVIFGFITATGTLGINISALVAGLGLTGFALGFAFRDALSNVLAGVMILFYHPFHRGDRVAITGLEGQVTAIDLRYTTLEDDKRTFLIPNSILLTNAIIVHKVEGIKQQPH
jgi:small-conductance mechanosensitive channel